jgi:cobalt-zinc-cadmium efflux system membrane fusion protein
MVPPKAGLRAPYEEGARRAVRRRRAPKKPTVNRFLVVLGVALASAIPVAGCRSAAPGHEGAAAHEEELPPISRLHFTERTELFVEIAPLVKGHGSKLAVHLTRATDWKPIAAGKVTVVLKQGDREEKFSVDAPRIPGIYGPVVTPTATGEHQVTIVLDGEGGADAHAIGAITVHPDEAAARAAVEPESGSKPITFLMEQQWRTEFGVGAVGERSLRASLPVLATVRARPDGDAIVRAPAAGRLVAGPAGAVLPGAQVRADDVFAAIAPTLVADFDVGALRLDVAEAKVAHDYAKRERERMETLQAQGVASEREVAAAKRDEDGAQARLSAAQQRLGQYQGTQRAGGGGASRVLLRAPIAGTVVSVDVATGSFVAAGDAVARIVDPTKLWIEARIPEADLARAAHPTGALIRVPGLDHDIELGPSAVVSLGVTVDPVSRTTPLLFALDGASGALRAGQSVRAQVLTGAAESALAIPLSAVVEDEGVRVAYVLVDGEAFERRPLALGIRDGGFVQVISGLAAGERVVTRGAYAVRLASASSSLPAHGHVH